MNARLRTPTLTAAQAGVLAAGFIARRRAMHGDATMTAGTGEQQQTGQSGEQQGGTGGEAAGQAGEQSGQAGGQPEPKFTQADLDRIIGERVAAEKARSDKAIKDAEELAGKNQTERLELERDQAKAAVTETQARAAQRIARTEAKGIARDLDARPERLDAILKQADLSKAVKDDGEVDEAALKAAVEKVLTDYPEWKKAPGGPSASGGELNGGGGGGKPTFTRKQIEGMSPAEVAERIDEINDAAANGRITG